MRLLLPGGPPPIASPIDVFSRRTKLDFAVAKALHGIANGSKESLHEDVVLERREFTQAYAILKGRQIVRRCLTISIRTPLQEQFRIPRHRVLEVDG